MGERGGPILVVDDDPKIVQLVRAYLEREGLAVVTAADGKAALAAIAAHDPRLVVLDLMLPELDGMTVARRVREDSDVPILMLSARASVADRIQGIAEGADDYLPKPFSPAELAVRVKAILRRSQGPQTMRCSTRCMAPVRRRPSTEPSTSTLAGCARSCTTIRSGRATSRPCAAPAIAPSRKHRRERYGVAHRPRFVGRRRGGGGDRLGRRIDVRRRHFSAADGRARAERRGVARDVR